MRPLYVKIEELEPCFDPNRRLRNDRRALMREIEFYGAFEFDR